MKALTNRVKDKLAGKQGDQALYYFRSLSSHIRFAVTIFCLHSDLKTRALYLTF